MIGIRRITVSSKPTTAELKVRFKRMTMEVSDLLPFHKKAAILLDGWVKRNFKAEGQALGTDSWAPFKAGGRKRKGTPIDLTAKLLQDTGALRLSFRPFASDRNAGIGSELPYSKPHEEGNGVPQRRMLPVESDVQRALFELLNRHVARGLT